MQQTGVITQWKSTKIKIALLLMKRSLDMSLEIKIVKLIL